MLYKINKYETNVITGKSYQVWPRNARYKAIKTAMEAIEKDVEANLGTILKVFVYQDPKEDVEGEQSVYEATTDPSKGTPYQVRYTIEGIA